MNYLAFLTVAFPTIGQKLQIQLLKKKKESSNDQKVFSSFLGKKLMDYNTIVII